MISPDPNLNLRRLVWIYFWLLIFEGALRKWIVPQLSDALLVIRDPVVLAAYAYAIHKRMFPLNWFLVSALALAFLCTLASLSVIDLPIFVTLYGMRTDFLHLPFIFLMARVLTLEDIRSFGRWILILSIPMALLMVIQFESPATSFINTGAGEGGGQISSALGKIRTPGTFSYILGPVFFYGLVTGFLIHGALRPGFYPRWLLISSCFALVAASIVSGSRSLFVNVTLIAGIGLIAVLCIKPILLAKFTKGLVLLALAAAGTSLFGFFNEGFQVISARVGDAGSIEGGGAGFMARAMRPYTTPFGKMIDAPLLGQGLGLGTNAGAAILTGKAQFLLAESEWDRLVAESGPILGGALIFWRITFTMCLGFVAVQVAREGDFLPVLLFSATFLLFLNGGWGVPTILGFAIFGTGLCLAVIRVSSASATRTRPASSSVHLSSSWPAII